jgi:hypothetical protein
MAEKSLPKLKVERAFKNLIRPLRRQEYVRLENSIIANGCKEPIYVWGEYIIDGHSRYEICHKHGIPFETEEIAFESKEEVIIWICKRQLKRKTITEEARKFLIGMQYECEKIVNKATRPNRNQYTVISPEDEAEGATTTSNKYGFQSGHRSATRIAEENHVSYGTVEKYAYYTRALEMIGSKEPELVPKILSGRFKISHSYILDMAKMGVEELREINARMNKKTTPVFHYSQSRSVVKQTDLPIPGAKQGNIKDMPEFDPDASITELTLTIPHWVGSIQRTQSHTDFSIISDGARKKLIEALTNLEEIAFELLILIQED